MMNKILAVDTQWEKLEAHFVLFQRFSQLLRSIVCDLILVQV